MTKEERQQLERRYDDLLMVTVLLTYEATIWQYGAALFGRHEEEEVREQEAA